MYEKNLLYRVCTADEAIDQIQGDKVQTTKFLRNGQIYIQRGEKIFTLHGV